MSGDFSDFVDIAVDVGSSVDVFGAEFLSEIGIDGLSAFDIPVSDLANIDAWAQVGDFAGNASWFDTFNPGDILSSIPSVGDFSLSSITDSLPSLSDIKNFAGGISSDFSGYVKQAQGAIQSYQKVAPTVNTVSSALGIQNPINQIIQPVSQAVGIASQAAGATSLISKSSIVASPGSQFVEMTSQQTNDLIARTINPAYVNSLVDPQAGDVTTYDAAILSKAELTTLKQDYETAIASNEQNIANANKNIEEMQANLQDPDLSPAQRASLEAQIKANQEAIAQYTDAYTSNLGGLSTVNDQLDNDNQIIAQTDANTVTSPGAVAGQVVDQYSMIKNTDGTYSIFDKSTGDTVQAGLTEQQAILAQQDLNLATPGITVNTNSAIDVAAAATSITGVIPNTGDSAGTNAQALVAQARNQNAIRALRQTSAQTKDWRVKLQLAPGADYLYKAPKSQVGILGPLAVTDGVIFPYTPAIETAYKANYSPYDLTHSNYRGYFYQGSYVDAINIRCTFTAQDTQEANYLLAVIHFFRSVTKMFYGQDAQHGAPPPLVYLSGLGDYQFAEHPCVVSQFNYTLPPDVDYIRAGSTVDNGTTFLNNRVRTTIGSNPLSYAVNRLLNNNLTLGAQDNRPNANGTKPPVDIPTYVPTKIEIAISLLPMQSRQQISTQFSLQAFSNGNLLRGGFW